MRVHQENAFLPGNNFTDNSRVLSVWAAFQGSKRSLRILFGNSSDHFPLIGHIQRVKSKNAAKSLYLGGYRDILFLDMYAFSGSDTKFMQYGCQTAPRDVPHCLYSNPV